MVAYKPEFLHWYFLLDSFFPWPKSQNHRFSNYSPTWVYWEASSPDAALYVLEDTYTLWWFVRLWLLLCFLSIFNVFWWSFQEFLRGNSLGRNNSSVLVQWSCGIWRYWDGLIVGGCAFLASVVTGVLSICWSSADRWFLWLLACVYCQPAGQDTPCWYNPFQRGRIRRIRSHRFGCTLSYWWGGMIWLVRWRDYWRWGVVLEGLECFSNDCPLELSLSFGLYYIEQVINQ